MDMTGNIWQWTDEFEDPHTRAGILRGGILPSIGFPLVFPVGLQTERARQVSADCALERPRGYPGFSLRQGCGMSLDAGRVALAPMRFT